MQEAVLRLQALVIVSSILLLVVPATVSAQSADAARATEPRGSGPPPLGTRAAERYDLRRQKAQNLHPYRAGRLERLLLSIDKAEAPSILDLQFGGFYPRVGGQSRNSGLSAGVRYWNPEIGGTVLNMHAAAFVSTRWYQQYDVQFGIMPHRENQLPLRSWRGDDVYELGDINHVGFRRLRAYASLRYRKQPEEIFFGLGPTSRRQDRTSYLLEDATYELVLGYQAASWLAMSLRSGYTTYSVRSGREDNVPSIGAVFDDATAPGLVEQPDYVHVSPQLFVDFRDEPGNPHRGFMLGVAYVNAQNTSSGAFRFERFAADARAFLPLGADQRVLALRALVLSDQPRPGQQVPFYLQSSLGSSHTLRGYDSFRFRGEDVALVQAEYRWEASPPVEFALFTDGGTVSAPGEDIETSTLHWNFGYGIRLKNYRAVLFRFDHAFGDERSRIIVRVSHSF